MAANLPGSTPAENAGNPSAGKTVLMNPLTGPAGSPKVGDAGRGDGSGCGISTGIGFGSPPVIGLTAPSSIVAAGFTDNATPGLSMPDGTVAPDSRLFAIGGGRSGVDGAVVAPFSAGSGLLMAGNGGSRDAGGGAGFATKMVTAVGTVANGADVETGYANRSGQQLVTGQSVFGSANLPSTVPA